jgi:hypothetical protein
MSDFGVNFVPFIKNLSTDVKKAWSIKSSEEHISEYAKTFLNCVHVGARKISIHYPKTLIISFVASTIFTIALPSLFTLMTHAVFLYLFYKCGHLILASNKSFSNSKNSEWETLYENKLESEKYFILFDNALVRSNTN